LESDSLKKNEYKVASLFAGMGGFCRAFKNTGFNVVWANEYDTHAAATYKHNFPDVKLLTNSITDISVLRDRLDPIDILTAGFPCQPFSVAGSKLGFNDRRGKLFFEVIRLIKEFGRDKPKILLLENVKNLLHHDGGKTLAKIVDEVQAAGYWFMPENAAILNTRDHTDIPQNRERIFMVAFSWDHFDINDFRFPELEVKKRKVQDFLDLDKKGSDELYFSEDSKYGMLFSESMKNGSKDSTYLLRRYYVRENKNDEVFTLTANMGGGGHNVPVIRDNWGIRKLTPNECLRLQGFTDENFSFPTNVSASQRYKQIGNAVTVTLVEKLAIECLRQLIERDKK
jgi:DNA (cytosine-5)-methyltransferase 1